MNSSAHGRQSPVRPASCATSPCSGRAPLAAPHASTCPSRHVLRLVSVGSSMSLVARRDVERGVAIEEPDGHEQEAGVLDRHDRPVLGPHEVRDAERVPARRRRCRRATGPAAVHAGSPSPPSCWFGYSPAARRSSGAYGVTQRLCCANPARRPTDESGWASIVGVAIVGHELVGDRLAEAVAHVGVHDLPRARRARRRHRAGPSSSRVEPRRRAGGTRCPTGCRARAATRSASTS